MRPLKLITFDVTNTLIKVNVSPGYQYASMARKCGVGVNETALQTAYSSVWKSFKRQYPIYGAKQGLTCRDWWYEFVFRVFSSAGFEGNDTQLREVARRLHTEFPQRAEFWEVLPSAPSVLEQLRHRGIELAVISNFDDRLEDVLSMLQLKDYFSLIVTSFSAKCEKPTEEIFEHVLNQFNVKAAEALHVGDHLEEDYQGALNVGMKAILYDPAKKYVPFTHERKERGYRIESLLEILDLVESDQKECEKV